MRIMKRLRNITGWQRISEMKPEEKIVITGMGAVTPIGTGVENYWNNLIDGACGIDRIRRFDPAATE